MEEVLAKISKYTASAKILEHEGASHHSAFKGSHLTIGHMLLALFAQRLSSPSRKWERGVSPSLQFIVLVFGVISGEFRGRRSSRFPCVIPVVETS